MSRRRIKTKQAESLQKHYLKYVKNAIEQSAYFKNHVELTTVKPFSKSITPASWKSYSPHLDDDLTVAELRAKNNNVVLVNYEYKWLALKVHFKDKQFDSLTDIRIQCLGNEVWIFVNFKHPFDYITRENYKVMYCPLGELDKYLIKAYELVQDHLDDFIENEQDTQSMNERSIDIRQQIINNAIALLKQHQDVFNDIKAIGFYKEHDFPELFLEVAYKPIDNHTREHHNQVIQELIDNNNNTKYLWATDGSYLTLEDFHYCVLNDKILYRVQLRKFRTAVDYFYSAQKMKENTFVLKPFE